MAASRNSRSTDPVAEAVAACLSRHATPGDSFVVGFSGGLDSTVLLHAAAGECRARGDALSAIHVHHGLSSRADDWQAHCAAVCAALDISLAVARVRVPSATGEGIEGAARRSRHAALARHPATWILLAHHADDQAETLLHNLLRGAGVRGAGAMPEVRGRLLRPLLALGRGDLEAYARRNDLRWIEDDSNRDRRFTRNYLRHEVLAGLATRFPAAGSQLAAAAARFREADALLDELAREDLAGADPAFPIPVSCLRALSVPRARNLLRALLSWSGLQPPTEARLGEFLRQLRTAGRDRHPRLELPQYSLTVARGKVGLTRKTADASRFPAD